MIYTNKNDAVENKIVTCFPVLVVKFNNYKSVYFIKHDYLYFVDNYFFSQICEENNILCANSEEEALALIKEIKSHPNSEQLINTFVNAVKSYNNPSSSPNEPQYLEHYFSVVRKEHVVTTSLMDNKYYTSPDEALAKAEFAYEEQKKVLDRLKIIKKDYLSKIEKVEKELENKKTDLNNIRAKIAERDGKNSDF